MRLALSLVIPLLAASAGAQTQQTFVFPKGSGAIQRRGFDLSYLGAAASALPGHIQHGYDLSALPVSVASVSQLAYRRSNAYGNNVFPSRTTLTLFLSHGSLLPSAFTTTFATNEGLDRTQGFTGIVNWPAASYSGPNPARFDFKIPLNRKFLVTRSKGKSLVVDIRLIARTSLNNGREYPIIIDADELARGKRSNNGSLPTTCKFSNNKYNNNLVYTTGGLTNAGGTWWVSYNDLLPNAAGFMTLSSFGIPRWGNVKLPIDLTGIGMPGCWWSVGLETGIWIPFKADANGRGRLPNVTIPAGLGGTSFYDHGLVLDKNANPNGLVTTRSSKWTIAKAYVPEVVTVARMKDTSSSKTGTVIKNYGAILEISY